MMLGMHADPAHPGENPPPPAPKDLGETYIFDMQASNTLENYRVLDTQPTVPKKWQPQKPSALIRDPKETKLRTAIYTLDWRRRISLVGSKRSLSLLEIFFQGLNEMEVFVHLGKRKPKEQA